VQAYLGYRDLLPLPSSKFKFEMDDEEDTFLSAWTKSRAIACIVQETNALLEEFEDSSQNETSSITFDIEPSTPTVPISTSVPALSVP
jgi:antibiotic biosynthesis monooxygenase (ABM) superfamily enzyme